MSLNKLGEKSLTDKKADSHDDSWRDEMREAKGSSSKELGIYNRTEVERKLKDLYLSVVEREEFEFIKEIKNNFPQAGVFMVGGSVRDAILGKEAKDIDLVVNGIEPTDLVDLLMHYGKITFDRNPGIDLTKISPKEKENLIKNCYGIIKFKPTIWNLKELIDIAFTREDNHSESGKSGIRGIKRDTETAANPKLNIIRDLERRDLTINAMAVNLIDGTIVDPFDGIGDLIGGKLRSVGDPRERISEEDLSRGLRAIRFACKFEVDIESNTKKAIRQIFQLAERPAHEIYKGDQNLGSILRYEEDVRRLFQIRSREEIKRAASLAKTEKEKDEILKLLCMPRFLQVFWDKEQGKPRLAVAREVLSKEILKGIDADPRYFLELLDEVGGLKIIFPELESLKGLSQPREYHREGDAWMHTLMVLDNLPENSSLALKLAAVFHDIGKSEKRKQDEKGKITFHGHDKSSDELFQKIAKRFKLNTKLFEGVQYLIGNHMLPLSEEGMKNIKATKLFDIFLKNKKLGEDLIALARADAMASIREDGSVDLKAIEILELRLREIEANLEKQGREKQIPKLISGNDLEKLGVNPGPEMGKIISKIKEAQLSGKIKSKEEALELALRFKNAS